MKKIISIVLFVLAALFVFSDILKHIISVSAQVSPLVVTVTELSYGAAFVGETLMKEFKVELGQGQGGQVFYRIIQNSPDASNLCPHLDTTSSEQEGDSASLASVGPLDTSDTWKVKFLVPAITGQRAQDHAFGEASVYGDYFCEAGVQILEGACGDGVVQSPNGSGMLEACDGQAGVQEGFVCTDECALQQITQPPSSGPSTGGGGGGGGGPFGLFLHNEGNFEVDSTSATVTWFTNMPSTSRVVYDTISHPVLGSEPNYGYAFSTPANSIKVTFHSVTITNLMPGTVYYWRPLSAASPEKIGDEAMFETQGQESPPGQSTSGEETSPSQAPSIEILPAQGNVAGAEFKEEERMGLVIDQGVESGLVLGQEIVQIDDSLAPTGTKEDRVVDELEEGKITVTAGTQSATTTAGLLNAESCVQILWFFLVVDVIVCLAIIQTDRKGARKSWVKDAWLYYLLLVLMPVIIGYPKCGLVWWLVSMGIVGGVYLLWRFSTPKISGRVTPSGGEFRSTQERIIPGKKDDTDTLFPPIE